ncbi:MAG: DUF3520 domain-containing protein [Verrucomicrobiaceae bacterium]
MNPQDNPHFTAYALGELSAEEACELHEILATTPAAAHELEQIEAVTDALRHGAPIPQSRLTHEQRHSVLHPSNLPRRMQPMMPRKVVQRPRQMFWPVMGAMLKAAAVIALTGAAFFAGWSFSPAAHDAASVAVTAAKEMSKSAPVAKVELAKAPAPEPVKMVAVPPVPKVELPAKETAPEPVKVASAESAKVEPAKEVKAAPVKLEVATLTVPASAPATNVPAPNLGFTMPAGRGAFASTTKQPVDQFNLHPALIKPAMPKPKGAMLASPVSPNAKPEAKPSRAPELFIHSWKAEVAACPWNSTHRLLRVVIQLPADQQAVLATDGAVFPLQVSFDAANVKQFRMLCERHVPATELRSAGTHVVWYEFQPNGTSEAARDRQIAVVTLPNTRFTSQAVGPFDSSKLQIIDRGYSLQNAREDFVFESAVVGFGLLLRGAEQTGSLDHDLVLNLAKQAKGADAGGERSRFVRLVQDAQRTAGL